MDNHRNFIRAMAARLFWPQDQSKIPANRELDPCFDRYCHYSGCATPVGDSLTSLVPQKISTRNHEL